MTKKEFLRQALEMGLSWLRVFAAASLAYVIATETYDWGAASAAGLASLLPVVLRALDPMDKTYGRTSE
jgi:hypothetical protein